MNNVKKSKLAVTDEQLAQMTNEELAMKISKEWRPFFPGKECLFGGSRFYLIDGMFWDFSIGRAVQD